MSGAAILIADDERGMVEFLDIMLRKRGCRTHLACSAEEAIEALEREKIDLTITDINMPRAGGMAVLAKALEVDREAPVIMITAYASTDSAIEAMKLGAYDYITKPFKVDAITLTIEKALSRREDRIEIARLKSITPDPAHPAAALARLKSKSARDMLALIKKVAPTRANVLIRGESGSGKEIIARAIHHYSDRSSKPFYSINLGAIPETLLESELFGHQKGAFTGAAREKKGAFEEADGGVFFLDEIGDAPLSIQVKLLRALQEREFRRVGSTESRSVDLRFIAATNQDLEALIKEGRFREDLYYRLKVITIEAAPLRERKEDIPILAIGFIERFARENQKKTNAISAAAMRALERYPWRGNTRELENVIERAVALTNSETIETDNLPDEILRPRESPIAQGPDSDKNDTIDLEAFIARTERDIIEKTLRAKGGVKRETAQALSMSLRSLRYKISKYKIGSTE